MRDELLIKRGYLEQTEQGENDINYPYYASKLLNKFGVVVDKPELLNKKHVTTIANFFGVSADFLLGMKKEQAANFSFLISMPIIGGAALYSAVKMFLKSPEAISSMPLFLTGIIAASVSGYFVIRFLLNFIKTDSFKIFMYYRIVLGLIILGMFFTGNLK